MASMRHIGMSAYMYTAAATLQMNQKQGLIANIRYQYFRREVLRWTATTRGQSVRR